MHYELKRTITHSIYFIREHIQKPIAELSDFLASVDKGNQIKNDSLFTQAQELCKIPHDKLWKHYLNTIEDNRDTKEAINTVESSQLYNAYPNASIFIARRKSFGLPITLVQQLLLHHFNITSNASEDINILTNFLTNHFKRFNECSGYQQFLSNMNTHSQFSIRTIPYMLERAAYGLAHTLSHVYATSSSYHNDFYLQCLPITNINQDIWELIKDKCPEQDCSLSVTINQCLVEAITKNIPTNLINRILYLDISNNQLKRFPSELKSLLQLRVLNISNNPFKETAERFPYNFRLYELIASPNQYKFLPLGLKRFVPVTVSYNEDYTFLLELIVHFFITCRIPSNNLFYYYFHFTVLIVHIALCFGIALTFESDSTENQINQFLRFSDNSANEEFSHRIRDPSRQVALRAGYNDADTPLGYIPMYSQLRRSVYGKGYFEGKYIKRHIDQTEDQELATLFKSSLSIQ